MLSLGRWCGACGARAAANLTADLSGVNLKVPSVASASSASSGAAWSADPDSAAPGGQYGACLPCSRLSGLMPSSASRGAARATAITSWVLATRVQTASPRRASTRLARTIPVNPQTGGGDPPYGDSGSPHWNAARREAGSDGRALAHKPGLPSSLELIFPSVAVGFALGPAVLGLYSLRSARESDSPVYRPRYPA